MVIVATRYEHIVLDAQGVPSIAATTMKVVELVTAQTAYGWSPEELHFQFPHLALGQIHSALAYYWDHRSRVTGPGFSARAGALLTGRRSTRGGRATAYQSEIGGSGPAPTR